MSVRQTSRSKSKLKSKANSCHSKSYLRMQPAPIAIRLEAADYGNCTSQRNWVGVQQQIKKPCCLAVVLYCGPALTHHPLAVHHQHNWKQVGHLEDQVSASFTSLRKRNTCSFKCHCVFKIKCNCI